MNFLAHAQLSGNGEDLLIGNFIGDFVKGSEMDNYRLGIRNGIILHRLIDQFTDSHAIVKRSKERIRHKYGHYSSVIMDLYYDHFLSKNWKNYSSIDLADYCSWVYRLMKTNEADLPANFMVMLKYMRTGNWLFNYQFVEGVGKALEGMSRRAKFDSKMDEATDLLQAHYQELEGDFFEFYPLLQDYCKQEVAKQQAG